MYVFVYVCMYACMYTPGRIFMYTHQTHMHNARHTQIHRHIHTRSQHGLAMKHFMHTHAHIYTRTQAHTLIRSQHGLTRMHFHIYTCTYKYTDAHTHTHTHTHTYPFSTWSCQERPSKSVRINSTCHRRVHAIQSR
jgi:hypothetical protein